jgi:hypothetical protein
MRIVEFDKHLEDVHPRYVYITYILISPVTITKLMFCRFKLACSYPCCKCEFKILEGLGVREGAFGDGVAGRGTGESLVVCMLL